MKRNIHRNITIGSKTKTAGGHRSKSTSSKSKSCRGQMGELYSPHTYISDKD